MNRCTMAAVIPLFAGYLWAQGQQLEELKSKANTTTWKGTLVDSGCPSRADRQKSSRSANRYNTRNSSDNRYHSNTSTTSYALITEGGKCIPFDLNSNEKISGLMKINRDWDENTVKMKPTKVEVTGTESGGTISVDEIKMESSSQPKQ